MRHLAITGLVLSTACGAEVASDPEPCELDPTALDKRWFVGELDTESDNPIFTLTLSVIGVEVDGPTPAAFVGATSERDVRFEVAEAMLIGRSEDQTLVSLFDIISHRDDACGAPYNPSGFGQEPQSLPWPERPWFRVDFSLNRAEPPRFDAATAAGHHEAATYTAIAHYPEGGFDIDTNQGFVAVPQKTFVSWRELDDGTPGCAYDMPSLEPAAECPPVLLTLRHHLQRKN